MSRVVLKRYLGKMPVYNMEVADWHNFITDGGTVLHNCDMLRYFCITRTMTPSLAAPAGGWDDDEEAAESYDEAMTGGEATESYLQYGGEAQ